MLKGMEQPIAEEMKDEEVVQDNQDGVDRQLDQEGKEGASSFRFHLCRERRLVECMPGSTLAGGRSKTSRCYPYTYPATGLDGAGLCLQLRLRCGKRGA